MNLGDWLDDEPSSHSLTSAAVRTLRILADVSGIPTNTDPWSALSGLRLMNDDKVYLHGVLNALQLEKPYAYAFLKAYREQWERAAQRCPNPNGADSTGLRAANNWIMDGSRGFLVWE